MRSVIKRALEIAGFHKPIQSYRPFDGDVWLRRARRFTYRHTLWALFRLRICSTHRLVIEWDNATCAFGKYGEVVQCLVLSRYLHSLGVPVLFRFVHSGSVRKGTLKNYRTLGLDIDDWNQEVMRLARFFLPQSAIQFSKVPFDKLKRADRRGYHWLGGRWALRLGLYRFCMPFGARFYDFLGNPPQDFFLDADETVVDPSTRGTTIGWHVRKGTWEPERSPTDEKIVEDFVWLCEAIPELPVVLYSTPNGVQHVVRTLEYSTEPRVKTNLSRLKAQSGDRFSELLPEILSSAFFSNDAVAG